jgi:hypothetical protein
MPTPLSATHSRSSRRFARARHVDAAALLARVDAVAHGVLHQGQQRHRRERQCASAASTSM